MQRLYGHVTEVLKTNGGDGTPHWLARRSKVSVDGGVAAVSGGVAADGVRGELTLCVMSSGELSSVFSLFIRPFEWLRGATAMPTHWRKRLPHSRSSPFPHAASLL